VALAPAKLGVEDIALGAKTGQVTLHWALPLAEVGDPALEVRRIESAQVLIHAVTLVARVPHGACGIP
jgi:hypothetical protein